MTNPATKGATGNLVTLRQPTFLGKLNPPDRPKNADVRPREYLTAKEIDRMRKAARGIGRHGTRDEALILVSYRHGLRVSEACALRWDHIDFDRALVQVHRAKGSIDSEHPLAGVELRALRKLKAKATTPFVFETERGGPMTTSAVRKLVARAGVEAAIGFPVHPHMFRHGCGYKLANDGVDTRAIQHYLGHASIVHTTRYTEMRADRFKGFWRD
jgi:type 1 fimbriae regulatory protein FimE